MRSLSLQFLVVLGCSCFLTPAGFAQSGTVFVADGAGNMRIPSLRLRSVMHQSGAPMTVERVRWQHGLFSPIRDVVNHQRHLDQGASLAARVQSYQMMNPGGRVVLVGHSAGAAVVLAAAEALPAGSVDRIVLLAPAVSSRFHLGSALLASREGIDTFNSRRDGLLASFVMATGTTDRSWRPSAGLVGFNTSDPLLRQHTWSMGDMASGHFGGHFSTTRSGYLGQTVLPLVAPGATMTSRPGLFGRVAGLFNR